MNAIPVTGLDRTRVFGSAAALVVVLAPLAALVAAAELGHVAVAALVGVAAVLAAAYAATRLLWPGVSFPARASYLVSAAAIAAFALVVGWLFSYVAITSAGLCGSDGASTPAAGWIVAAVVYALGGVWGFQRPRRLLWAWAAAVLLGLVLGFVVDAAIPSAHGYCET
jgi:hypothetical protein